MLTRIPIFFAASLMASAALLTATTVQTEAAVRRSQTQTGQTSQKVTVNSQDPGVRVARWWPPR